jgi:DNA-directed RNA polymerase subunit N (RpoN/RPB10)
MIIPPRCFTCGKILSDKYNYFKSKLSTYNRENNIEDNTETMISTDMKKTKCGQILDELEITKYCCRRIFISHVDLIDII